MVKIVWYIKGNMKDIKKKFVQNGGLQDKELEEECWASNINLHNFLKIQLFLVGKIHMTQKVQMDHHSCEKMEWHVPYNIGVDVHSLISCR